MTKVTRVVNENSPLAGKWSRPCSVKFEFHDIDHANKFAEVMSDLLTKASGGGDFELNGLTVGHDVNCLGIVVEAP